MYIQHHEGLIWSEVKQLWDVGLQSYVLDILMVHFYVLLSMCFCSYILDMWNVIDFITNSLYVATVALRVVSYFQVSMSYLIFSDVVLFI
jgi:hypothetical protein